MASSRPNLENNTMNTTPETQLRTGSICDPFVLGCCLLGLGALGLQAPSCAEIKLRSGLAPRRAKVAESSGWLMNRDFNKMDMNH